MGGSRLLSGNCLSVAVAYDVAHLRYGLLCALAGFLFSVVEDCRQPLLVLFQLRYALLYGLQELYDIFGEVLLHVAIAYLAGVV